MAKIEVVPATADLVFKMFGRLRAIDQKEARVICGQSAEEALHVARISSKKPYVALIDGDPAIAFGVAGKSILSITGVPWLASTDRIYEIPYHVIRKSLRYVEEFKQEFHRLENYVHTKNIISRNWLKWLGFTVEPAEPIGAQKELFHRFWLRRD